MKYLLLVILFFPGMTQLALGADVKFAERTPAYFVDRYDHPKTAKNVTTASFFHATKGAHKVAGQFSVREYRSDDLHVYATFHLPSLKLAAVRYQLPRQWTPEQIAAALAANGTGWKLSYKNVAVKVWTNPEGLKAIFLLTMLEIQTPAVVAAVERGLQEAEAKRKAVPKF